MEKEKIQTDSEEQILKKLKEQHPEIYVGKATSKIKKHIVFK